MIRISVLSLILTAIATGLWIITIGIDKTESPREPEAMTVLSSLKEEETIMFQDVLLFTQNIEEAKLEIEGHGGRITHIFSPDVFIAHIPQSLDFSSLQKSQSSSHKGLEPTVQIAIDAWKTSVNKKETTPPETDGLRWDSPGYQPPGYHNP